MGWGGEVLNEHWEKRSVAGFLQDSWFALFLLCGSRKYPYPPHGWSLQIPRAWGGGSRKPKFLKESMKLNQNFQRGGGASK